MIRTLASSTLILLTGCGSLSAEGEWTGQCITGDAEARVRLDIWEEHLDEPILHTDAFIHLAERPAEVLILTCDLEEPGIHGVRVHGCTGAWSTDAEPGPHGFTIDGNLEREEPTDLLTGACTFEEAEGAVELVRTP